MDKRTRKLETLVASLPVGRRLGVPDAPVRLLGVGMTYGPMTEAAERLAAEGLEVAVLVPRTLWPVPDESVGFINDSVRTYVVEHSASGQLSAVLRSAGAEPPRMRRILRYDGTPYTAGEIAETVRSEEARR